MSRDLEQKKWLSNYFDGDFEIQIASEDASFRKYYRIIYSKHSFILMDAPLKMESLDSFLSLGQLMLNKNIRVPKIYEKSEEKGFVLLEDFGVNTFLFNFKQHRKLSLYTQAIDKIIDMQLSLKINDLKNYSKAFLLKEINLFHEWYLKLHKKIIIDSKEKSQLDEVFNKIVSNNFSQKKYFVHRDFHSRNLMILDDNDPYIELEEEVMIDLVIKYWEKAVDKNLLQKGDFADFFMQFELMGVQRHLKVLGIFSRLSIRDKKNNYLKDLPLVEKYLLKATERYQFLSPLKKILLRSIDA
jgi:aminoglycoside/choline kinase family phosphotransferase